MSVHDHAADLGDSLKSWRSAPAPADLLNGLLSERGWNQQDLADQIGVAASHTNRLCRSQITVSAAMAVKLEGALGVPATVWVVLQALSTLSNLDQDTTALYD
jgi:addiction module HigA family antidote